MTIRNLIPTCAVFCVATLLSVSPTLAQPLAECENGVCRLRPESSRSGASDRYEPFARRTQNYRDQTFQAPRPVAQSLQPVSYERTEPGVRWEHDFRTSVQQSLNSGQPLLVQITAEWCGYCQKMKRDTLVHPGVATDINRAFVAVMVDADSNRELVQQLQVKSLPTTLVILPEGRIVERLEGFQSASQMQTMLARYQQRAEKEGRVRAERNTDRRVAIR